MLPLLKRYKPGGRIATHLLLSAVLWSGIGLFLLYRGVRLEGGVPPYLLTGAVLAGSLKSWLILDHRARQAISRILAFSDSTCLGAVYSLKTWILVLCMVAAGGILRSFSLPVLLLCFLYLTLGWALLWSSRLAWVAWLKGLESR